MRIIPSRGYTRCEVVTQAGGDLRTLGFAELPVFTYAFGSAHPPFHFQLRISGRSSPSLAM